METNCDIPWIVIYPVDSGCPPFEQLGPGIYILGQFSLYSASNCLAPVPTNWTQHSNIHNEINNNNNSNNDHHHNNNNNLDNAHWIFKCHLSIISWKSNVIVILPDLVIHFLGLLLSSCRNKVCFRLFLLSIPTRSQKEVVNFLNMVKMSNFTSCGG